MKQQKNLDELYRERLLGKEVPPPPDAWNNIVSQLPAKQPERKVLPLFWYKLGGIAAALLIAATVALDNFVASGSLDSETSNPGITSEDPQEVEQTEQRTYRSFEEQIPENVNKSETIISENRSVKKGKKLTSFTTATTLASETTEHEKDLEDRPGIRLPSGETEKDPITVEAKIISEEITPGVLASEEIESPLQEEHEEVETHEVPGSRLRLSTKVAPLFTNATDEGQGSAGNSIAYGLSLSYKISEKIAIRTGINKMEISRGAPAVTYAGGVQARSLLGSSNTTLAAPTVDVAERNSGFFELPLEMEYTLIDKKLQLHLVGGSSLLFLSDNSIEINGITPDSGYPFEQQKLHYTGNIGLGLGYDLFKNIEINLEPSLKIRLGSSENLSSYYLGIYSGLSYRF